MANSEDREKNVENSNTRRQRHNFQNYRPPYSARGRGRHDPHIAKAIHNFGVSDLRELLDRKHLETQTSVLHRRSKSSERQPICQRFANRSKSTERRSDNRSSFIHDADNIQVELSTSTGQRNLIIDQEKKLPNIRHVPDHELADQHIFARGKGRGNFDPRGTWRGRGGPPRGRGGDPRGRGSDYRGRGGEFRGRGGEFRGRGGEMRMRGRGGENRGRGYSSQNSNLDDYAAIGSSDSDNVVPGRGRGNYRGRRGNPRGRSQRGNRGRGQNYSRDDEYKVNPIAPAINTQNEVITEENWDDEILPAPVAPEQNQFESSENEEHHDLESYADAQTSDHIEGNYLNHNTEEYMVNYEDDSNNEFVQNEEDNLIITYPTEEESRNRVVRFNLPQSDIGKNESELDEYVSEGNNQENLDLISTMAISEQESTKHDSENDTNIVNDLSNLEIKSETTDETDRKCSDFNENLSDTNVETKGSL